MSTVSPTPAAPMAPATSTQPDPLPATAAPGAHAARPAVRFGLGDNPMQTVLGAAVVGLLIFSLTSNSSRISRLEDAVNAGFAAQDAQIDAKFAVQDAKIDARFAAQDAKFEARFDQIDARFAAQDAKFEARFDQIDARFVQIDVRLDKIEARLDRLEARIHQLEVKLTALIAALNMTDAVAAAIEGRLLSGDGGEPSS